MTGLLTWADDSGLEVDALGGRPGVYSARFGGPGLNDCQRFERLLAELAAMPEQPRTARFRCVVALAIPGLGDLLHRRRRRGADCPGASRATGLWL